MWIWAWAFDALAPGNTCQHEVRPVSEKGDQMEIGFMRKPRRRPRDQRKARPGSRCWTMCAACKFATSIRGYLRGWERWTDTMTMPRLIRLVIDRPDRAAPWGSGLRTRTDSAAANAANKSSGATATWGAATTWGTAANRADPRNRRKGSNHRHRQDRRSNGSFSPEPAPRRCAHAVALGVIFAQRDGDFPGHWISFAFDVIQQRESKLGAKRWPVRVPPVAPS